MIHFADERPIFVQIAEGIEDAILLGAYAEGQQIPSITEFAVRYQINPATALKGINLLVEQRTVHKRRGVGMFVSAGAVQALRQKRRQTFYDTYIKKLVDEARRLHISPDEIATMLERGFEDERN